MSHELDYLQALGVTALGTRLRRLFEALNGPVSELYRTELGFEQRWFALSLLLEEKGSISVQRAADALGTSHVSVLQISKGMEKNGLLKRARDPSDARVSLLALSPKGRALMAGVHGLSARVDEAALALLSEASPDFLQSLKSLENALSETGFGARLKRVDAANLQKEDDND